MDMWGCEPVSHAAYVQMCELAGNYRKLLDEAVGFFEVTGIDIKMLPPALRKHIECERKIKSDAEFKRSALAKLSPEEKRALGIKE